MSEVEFNDKLAQSDPAAAMPKALSWPLPPYFVVSGGATQDHALDCAIELLNGRIISAELLAFDPDVNGIAVTIPGREGPQRLKLENIRVIRLTRPLTLAPDIEMVVAVGSDTGHVAEQREVTVRFRDGKTLAGKTCGFIREHAGLFLYLFEDESHQVIRSFIPTQQYEDVQIGPLLGEALVRNQQIDDRALDTAVDKQAKLRQEKLGTLLLNRGIISQDDLKLALQSQKHLPMMKLGDLLLDAGLIKPEQLADALRVQASNRKRRLGEILVDIGAVSLQLVQMALSDKLGIPFVNVHEFQIDPMALELLSAAVANRYQALPLLRIGNALVVAMENPLATDFIQELRFLTDRSVVPVIANPDDLRVRIAKEYASLALANTIGDGVGVAGQAHASDTNRGHDIAQMKVEDLTTALTRDTVHPVETKENDFEAAGVTDNALVRLVNKIIIEAHAQGASDIHIESNTGKANTRIRFRKDGDLVNYLELPPAYRNALVSRIKIMAGLDISERRHAQDGKITFSHFGPLQIELRVAVVPTIENLEDVVMRILGGVEPLPLNALGLHPQDLAELKKMVSRSYGLFLVCGPTGSGKTTTLHSVLHHINRPDIKIWTAEDPVEISQPGLRQVQINSHIDWTFAAAMRAFLRADPDVIMVGEIRDSETAKIAIEASLTGHLVFSTLHTNSAAESVVRLLDLGMDTFNFADALIGILSQRLARKLCPHCKRAHVASTADISELLDEYCAGTELDKSVVLAGWRKDYAHDGQLVLYEPVGCEACHSGYKGRIGVYELLRGSERVKQLVRSRATVPQIVQAGCASGMRLLRQDAIDKVLEGYLDRISARAVSI